MRVPSLLAAAAALMLTTGAAHAADASAERAAGLERDIGAWVADMIGSAVKLPMRPVRVEPAGDSYRVVVPFGGDVPALTATLREAEDGRWAVRDVKFPSPARFGVDLPGAGGAPGAKVRTDYAVKWAEQEMSAVFDPSYRTPSTWASSSRGFELRAVSGGEESTTRIARSAGQSALRPAGDGRIDLISDSTAEGYAAVSTLPNGQSLKVDIDRLREHYEFNGVSRAQVPRLLRATVGLVGGALAAGAAGAEGTVLPTELRAMLEAMQDFASSGRTEQATEGLRVRVGELGGTAERAQLGIGVTTPDGILALSMDIMADGIQAPDLPLSPAQRELVPRRVALRPVVSGIAASDFIRLLLDATDPDQPRAPDLNRLFSRGGLVVGLESFALDLGGASFKGNARVAAPTPMSVGGEGQVTATGFEGLLDRVKAVPEFRGAVPALAFAKGIARTAGERLVWDLTYRDGRMLVNDVDLSAMAGGGRR